MSGLNGEMFSVHTPRWFVCDFAFFSATTKAADLKFCMRICINLT